MIDFKTSGMDEINRKLDALAEHIKGNVITAGCAAAAKEFYIEAKLRCPVSEAPHMFHGTHGVYGPYSPGHLRDSIYRTLSKDNSTDTRITYHVAWNHTKAPYGFMVEYGTSRAAAHPFLRPAYDAAKGSAVKAAQQRMLDKMKELQA